uniref:40S ribosomal protein S25 n=1 Tax=Coptotermes formosanus TaxID=36987 RepID=R4UJH1_COPFO|nr:S25 ribosomal protein [Coptotermes formosanus]
MGMSAKAGKKKKWNQTAKKEKRDFAVILLPEVAKEIMNAIPNVKSITPGKLAEKYKISVTVARQVLKQLEVDGYVKLIVNESTLKAYAGTGKKNEVAEAAKEAKKGGKQQAKGKGKEGAEEPGNEGEKAEGETAAPKAGGDKKGGEAKKPQPKGGKGAAKKK